MATMASQTSRLFTHSFIPARIKENIKAPRHWLLTGEFPVQRVSNAENVSIWWRHHVYTYVTKHNTEMATNKMLMAVITRTSFPYIHVNAIFIINPFSLTSMIYSGLNFTIKKKQV